MLAAVGLAEAELSLVLTDDAEIRALNRSYRQKDRSTDVLAFAMREGPGPLPAGRARGAAREEEPAAPEMLGDVVISVPTAQEQAKNGGRALRAELQTLLAHGLLHLLGYDHRTRDEERKMKAHALALCRAACKPKTK